MKLAIFLILTILCAGFDAKPPKKSSKKCPPGSLAQHDLPALLEASKDEECLAEARKEFKKKYGNEFTTIQLQGPMYYEADALSDIEKKGMTSFEESQTLLKNFGDLIVVLVLNCQQLDYMQAKELAAAVSEKCSDTLQRLHLRNLYGHLVAEIKHKFKAAHLLEFSSNGTEVMKLPADDQKFELLFPNMTVLSLVNAKSSDWAFLQGKYANLKMLNVHNHLTTSEKANEAREREMVKFIRVNRNLLSAHLENTNLKFLKDLSKYLPKLGRLALEGVGENYHNYKGKAVKFDKMQMFSFIMTAEGQIPENIDLKAIEGLELVLGEELDKEWFEFLKKKVNKKLHTMLLNAGHISAKNLLAVHEQFPELVLSVIQTASYFTAKDIETVLSKNTKLMQLQWVISMKQAELKKLDKSLNKKWVLKADMIPQRPDLMRIIITDKKALDALTGQSEGGEEDEDENEPSSATCWSLSMSLLATSMIIAFKLF